MASLDVKLRIDRVNEVLAQKGFEDIFATHYDNTPSRLLVLHDDHGRIAHAEEDDLIRIIQGADEVSGLWSTLECSGMTRRAVSSQV